MKAHCEQLQLKIHTLQLDLETEQKRSMSYFNQIMELEKERDQVRAGQQASSSLFGAAGSSSGFGYAICNGFMILIIIIIMLKADAFIQSDIQLIRLSRGQSPMGGMQG